MAVTYPTAVKTARMAAVIAQIDAGAGPGTLEIGSAGFASTLAVLTLADPCGSAASGVLTFDFDPDISDTSANASGTAAEARIKDSDGTVVISGLTVGLSAADVILDSLSITAGQTVTVNTGTITHA
jgi:hypothetical protein